MNSNDGGDAMGNTALKEECTIQLKDGRLIGYAEYGDPLGTPIFYFHGFPGSRLEAGRYHDVAIKNHFRLIGIDRPGMGLSSIDPERTVLSWANDVAEFADCLGIKTFSIIGHSGGGPLVAACAYAIPERLNGAAIVSGMGPLAMPESRIGMAFNQKISIFLIHWMPWLAPSMMKLTRNMVNNPKMLEKMIKQLPEVDQVLMRDPELLKSFLGGVNEAFRNGVEGPAQEMKLLDNSSKSWGFELENIQYPVAIWHGTVDAQAPVSHARIYARLIPNATLRIIENEGHLSLIHHYFSEILGGN